MKHKDDCMRKVDVLIMSHSHVDVNAFALRQAIRFERRNAAERLQEAEWLKYELKVAR